MTRNIDVGILKRLNFFILQKKLKKNMPPTRLLDQKSKKAEKCVFFAAGLKNIIVLKNKKTYKSVFCLFYISVTAKKSTAYAKF